MYPGGKSQQSATHDASLASLFKSDRAPLFLKILLSPITHHKSTITRGIYCEFFEVKIHILSIAQDLCDEIIYCEFFELNIHTWYNAQDFAQDLCDEINKLIYEKFAINTITINPITQVLCILLCKILQ